MTDDDIKSEAFQQARLKSERARVITLLIVFASLLMIVLMRGGMSLAQGHRGESWPFAALLAAMTAYEAFWLKYVDRAMASRRQVSDTTWTMNIVLESLLPTIALVLQVHTSVVGPRGTLTSPTVLAYLLFIILSTLHLTPNLSRLAGIASGAGYAAVSVYVFTSFPGVAGSEELLTYGTSLSTTALLLVGGFAAGAVAQQIRLHVVAALREAESQAKIAQLQHDLGIARSIQVGLLPKSSPQIDGFDIAGWNKPADETGGDYFDWQQLPDGRIAVTVADVTGHGIGSALCMAACRSYARLGFATSQEPRTFLCRMNQLLHEDLPAEKFVTLATGLLSPDDATMQLISAGHGPLIFYSAADDRFHGYDAQGLPLGLLPRVGYEGPHTLQFSRGDILLLVTDGFVEWVNTANEDFGEERVKEVIRTHKDRPASTIISELYSAVLRFAGSMPQLDDLTALVVKRV